MAIFLVLSEGRSVADKRPLLATSHPNIIGAVVRALAKRIRADGEIVRLSPVRSRRKPGASPPSAIQSGNGPEDAA